MGHSVHFLSAGIHLDNQSRVFFSFSFSPWAEHELSQARVKRPAGGELSSAYALLTVENHKQTLGPGLMSYWSLIGPFSLNNIQ